MTPTTPAAPRPLAYVGRRFRSRCRVVAVRADGRAEDLRVRLDLANHSPDGFEWGYGGSGPAQLALAILADYLGCDDSARALYQQFKWDVVTTWEGDCWRLAAADLDAWLRVCAPAAIAAEGGAAC